MASQDMLASEAPPTESRLHASIGERDSRAALFAAAICVAGMLVFLLGQLGWWTILAGPAYLVAAGITAMLAQGRTQTLLAVALATGSMAILVGLVKLSGLA